MDEFVELPELSKDEVLRLIRLLVDALAPDDGRAAKVARLMAGLCQWVDADGWIWVRSRIPDAGRPQNIDFLYGGEVTGDLLGVWADRSMEVHGTPPEHRLLYTLLARGEPFTRTRPQLVNDAEWQELPNKEWTDRFGFGEMLFSIMPLQADEGGTYISGVVLLRRQGRPPFDPRHASLAHALFREVGPLHADTLRTEIAADVASLTSRQRVVLALLLDGGSIPAIATQLALSPWTVKDHVKVIYKHFQVNSRAQLLRKLIGKS